MLSPSRIELASWVDSGAEGGPKGDFWGANNVCRSGFWFPRYAVSENSPRRKSNTYLCVLLHLLYLTTVTQTRYPLCLPGGTCALPWRRRGGTDRADSPSFGFRCTLTQSSS